MSYPVGTVRGNNTYVRCWYCGDSQHRQHVGHMAISAEGLYHCHRCNAGGKLSVPEYIEHVLPYSDTFVEEIEEVLDRPQEAPAYQTPRYTVIPAYDAQDTIAFPMRMPDGTVCGYHYRHKEAKTFRNEGELGYGYAGNNLVTTGYLRIVEGVYDCIDPNDVCVFGLITPSKLYYLRWYNLVLCPDGDVWVKPSLLRKWLGTLEAIEYNQHWRVEYQHDGKDRDEQPAVTTLSIDNAIELCYTRLSEIDS